MKKIVLCAAVIGAFSGIAQAQNENVTWQAPATVSGASDVSTEGSYYASWAPYDGNAVNGNYPVNGVVFQAYSDIPNFSTTGFDNGYNGFPNPGTGNSNYNSLLQYGAYDDTGSSASLTWTDIPGHTYLIEIWVNGNAANRSETFTGGTNTSATVNFGNSPQYIIGTYVADSSGSETITLSGAASANGNDPQVNLVQIRDISGPNISWQAPAAISGASDVSTQGTYFGSWAPYASSSLAVNGVTFQTSSDLPKFSNTGFTAGNTAFPNPGTPNANYNTLLESGAYETPGPACTFSWGGMTPGHEYLVQFWVNGNDSARTETLSGGANTSATINYEPGQYIIGTFVANSYGTETVTLNGNPSDNSPQVNLVQVRDITTTAFSNYQGAVISDNPIGYWPLNLSEDNNGIATDFSGNGNNGTYFNISSANLVAGPAPYVTNAVSFNSAEVYFTSATNQPVLNFTGPTTLEAWVQPSQPAASASGLGDIIAKGYDPNANDQEITLRENASSGANYYGYFGTGGVSGGAQNTNWVYLVVANDGTNDYLYINSVLVQTNADIKGSIAFADTIGWAIGNGTSGGNGRFFSGNICQAAIYNYGLSSAQVLKHYYAAEVNASPSTSAPLIQTQPQTQESYVGGSATFSVTALSALPMTNQWYEGSTPLPGQTNSTLTLTNLSLSSAGSFHVVVGNANGTTTSATAALTISVPSHLDWSATGSSGAWDVDTSTNWLNLANNTPTVFNQGDYVLFDDTPGVATTVNVNGTIVPTSITVNSSANNFTIQSGGFSGPGNFVKEGSSSLILNCSSGLSGSVSIQGGSVSAGNNVFNDVSSITVTNAATLNFGGSSFSSLKPITVSGTGLNGEGALYNSTNAYPAEPLSITMTGNTSFGGSARWDLASGSQITGAYDLTVDWSGGAGYGQWNSVTIGANVPQITVTNAGTLGFTGMDTSCQNPATLLDISGTNSQVTIYSGGFNGNVNVQSGAQMTVAAGGANVSSSSIHVYSGAALYLEYEPITLTGNNLILENGSSLQSFYNSGANTIDNQVILNGVAHFVLGDHTENFSNVISGVGGFVLDYYNNDMVFASSNTYSGPTVIGSSGSTPLIALSGNGSITHSPLIFFGGNSPTVPHIDVSGRSDQTLTLANGQTLEGIGGVNGSLVVTSGAIISPGGTNTTIGITTGANPVGTLAASDNITLNGTTIIKLDGTNSDMIEAAANMTYGGTLNLINISGSPLTAGSFQIFNAAVYSGSFTTITLPTLGAGLAWNTNQLNSSGIISVVSTAGPSIGSSYVSGGNFIFSGTGGASSAPYYVLTTTNLSLPLSQWAPIATNTFSSAGGFSVTNPLSGGGPHRFYIIKQ